MEVSAPLRVPILIVTVGELKLPLVSEIAAQSQLVDTFCITFPELTYVNLSLLVVVKSSVSSTLVASSRLILSTVKQ